MGHFSRQFARGEAALAVVGLALLTGTSVGFLLSGVTVEERALVAATEQSQVGQVCEQRKREAATGAPQSGNRSYKDGENFKDPCVAAIFKKSAALTSAAANANDVHDPRNYECVGKKVVVSIQSNGVITERWDPAKGVPAGTCQVSACNASGCRTIEGLAGYDKNKLADYMAANSPQFNAAQAEGLATEFKLTENGAVDKQFLSEYDRGVLANAFTEEDFAGIYSGKPLIDDASQIGEIGQGSGGSFNDIDDALGDYNIQLPSGEPFYFMPEQGSADVSAPPSLGGFGDAPSIPEPVDTFPENATELENPIAGGQQNSTPLSKERLDDLRRQFTSGNWAKKDGPISQGLQDGGFSKPRIYSQIPAGGNWNPEPPLGAPPTTPSAPTDNAGITQTHDQVAGLSGNDQPGQQFSDNSPINNPYPDVGYAAPITTAQGPVVIPDSVDPTSPQYRPIVGDTVPQPAAVQQELYAQSNWEDPFEWSPPPPPSDVPDQIGNIAGNQSGAAENIADIAEGGESPNQQTFAQAAPRKKAVEEALPDGKWEPNWGPITRGLAGTPKPNEGIANAFEENDGDNKLIQIPVQTVSIEGILNYAEGSRIAYQLNENLRDAVVLSSQTETYAPPANSWAGIGVSASTISDAGTITIPQPVVSLPPQFTMTWAQTTFVTS